MSPRIVQPMLFANREVCAVDRSSSLTARFSANFRDFPNTGPPTAEIGLFQPNGAPRRQVSRSTTARRAESAR
jgi:hypothetical protein